MAIYLITSLFNFWLRYAIFVSIFTSTNSDLLICFIIAHVSSFTIKKEQPDSLDYSLFITSMIIISYLLPLPGSYFSSITGKMNLQMQNTLSISQRPIKHSFKLILFIFSPLHFRCNKQHYCHKKIYTIQ